MADTAYNPFHSRLTDGCEEVQAPDGSWSLKRGPVIWWTCVHHLLWWRMPRDVDDMLRHVERFHPSLAMSADDLLP